MQTVDIVHVLLRFLRSASARNGTKSPGQRLGRGGSPGWVGKCTCAAWPSLPSHPRSVWTIKSNYEDAPRIETFVHSSWSCRIQRSHRRYSTQCARNWCCRDWGAGYWPHRDPAGPHRETEHWRIDGGQAHCQGAGRYYRTCITAVFPNSGPTAIVSVAGPARHPCGPTTFS